MSDFRTVVEDYKFILYDVLRIQEKTSVTGYDELTEDTTQAILDEAEKLARDVIAPLNAVGDEGCVFKDGQVYTPPGFSDALRQLREGGWPSLECDPTYGGQGIPAVLSYCVGELFSSANMSLMMYNGLTHGAYTAILQHGNEAQKKLFLPKLVSGEWTGTMNLTEPQCGTDLRLITTKAIPAKDGSYHITGQKIFISCGEHDASENIIHLVLARIEGAPEGNKGLSLFVVPKFIPDMTGMPGKRNTVHCGSIEEKMGIHGNATCVMNYDTAQGWLIGQVNGGLKAMFTMMNEARLLVAMQGLAQASGAYQKALRYAKQRKQGQSISSGNGANKDIAPEAILVHPDVRRMLLEQKSFIEGARVFLLWGAELLDTEKKHTSPDKRENAADLVALLTPVLKGFLTDKGFEMCVQAQQVFGGHGYIKEWGVEQYVRDARIAQIYEGTNGIQAMDLVGRKLGMKNGKIILEFFEMIKVLCKQHDRDDMLKKDFLTPLKAASKDLQAACMYFMQNSIKNPNTALAGATDFMHLFGHVVLGVCWTWTGIAAQKNPNHPLSASKIATGRYYMQRVLPETALRLKRIESGCDALMDIKNEYF
jgi:alkylation response protein AidB-like acyl-CoA dehydrogenase